MIIRPLTDDDRELLQTWIDHEPDHKDNTPDFYFEPHTKSVLYQDEEGPVFAVRYSSTLRIDIEFSDDAGKNRIRKALKEGFPAVAEQAKSQGFKQIVFSSTSKTLIAFCRLLGFRPSPDYRKIL